jgi:predicted phosphodiesterase
MDAQRRARLGRDQARLCATIPCVRRGLVVAILLASSSVATAASVHGLVFDDANADGLPSPGESGIPGAIVSCDGRMFATTDRGGQYTFDCASDPGIVWVRVPNGFRPGPVWARTDPKSARDVDLALHRLPATVATPVPMPASFVVASDTHIAYPDQFVTAADLASAATAATALDPEPAFFTVLGDITQGNRPEEFSLVDAALGGLGVPFIPVPGNHDWWDGGEAWFAHYGPDNYSFDVGTTHFIVWNMMMGDDAIRAYLGAELAHVDPSMTIVALTHAPPSDSVVDVLRELGVDYVLTGHAHSNRVVDHDGLIELNTEPFLMGGLDFTPAGYRVFTVDGSRLSSYHRTTVDEPLVRIVWPSLPRSSTPRSRVSPPSWIVRRQSRCGPPVASSMPSSYRVSLPARTSST